jgi:DNA-binding response OmpR family regulator
MFQSHMTQATEACAGHVPILLVDDDRKLCELMKISLASSGYAVTSANTPSEALYQLKRQPWQAVLLDLMLPEMNGFELLREIRKSINVPVLMLTARGEEHNCVLGLDTGADDYLVKTLSPAHIVARIKAVIRRSERAGSGGAVSGQEGFIEAGPLRIHPNSRTVTLEDRTIYLTSIEFQVLKSLASAKGAVKKRSDLMQEIYGREYQDLDRSIDVHISSLRRKLSDDPREPRFIRTVRSIGYTFLDTNA